jgi:hypothetical protein
LPALLKWVLPGPLVETIIASFNRIDGKMVT